MAIDTIEISTPDGKTTGPIPYEDFAERAERGADRLRSESQLSFNLGTGRGLAPDYATLKIKGDMPVKVDLLYGQAVSIQVIDRRSGEMIAEADAGILYPTFVDHFDTHGSRIIERKHTASID